ncbi:MAG: serine/threonine-protein kinase [Pseudomonadota bacterium]
MAEIDWARLESLFERAVALPKEAQEAFIADNAGDSPEIAAQLRAMLAADAQATSGSDLLARAQASDNDLIGTEIDRWRLLERIGSGGMGVVFLAERTDGNLEQRAALKIIKRGMDTDHVVQRFRQERQILAKLEHPNIARVYDGGVTVDGRPYFVMEHVDGLPITTYCDTNKLGIEQRLKLFQRVCDAVHAAHRNLIVHRDLKPSNIMVTDEGELKLLDFGIAKSLEETDDPGLTKTGLNVHTPAYAAPEQLLNEDVTTATDVYALGVILYELLAGRRPYEIKRSADEFRDLVVSGTPPKPSAAITVSRTDGTLAETISGNRGLRTDRLQRSLRGDLDTICLMALHREPQHRYPSADQVAADIGRYLRGQPVVAQPDSLAYRISKFVRRNRAGVAATAVVTLAFAGLVAFYTQRLAEERDVALAEQQKANEVVSFVTGLFEVSDPSESRGEEITARELLDAGSQRIAFDLAEQPEVRFTMQRVLGQVYSSLGAHQKARAILEEALAGQLEVLGDSALEVATTRLWLGRVLQNAGDNDGADVLYREAMATRRAALGGDSHEVLEVLSVRAFLEETLANFDEAEALYQQALALSRKLYSGDHPMVAKQMQELGGLYRVTDRAGDAEPILRDALAMQDRLFEGRHPEKADTKRQLAGLLRDTNRFEESKVIYLDLIASRTAMLGEEHHEVANTWNSYSQLLLRMNDVEGAIAANAKTIDIIERIYGGPHPSLGAAYNNYALMLRDAGDLEGALRNYELSVEMQDLVELPADHPNRTFPLTGMAAVYIRMGRFEEAEPILRSALVVRRQAFGEDHRLVTETKTNLGKVAFELGNTEEGEALLLEAYGRFLEGRGPDASRTKQAARHLAELYDMLGDEEKASEYRALSTGSAGS